MKLSTRSWPVALGLMFALGISQTRCGGGNGGGNGLVTDGGTSGDDGSILGDDSGGAFEIGTIETGLTYDVQPATLQTITVMLGATSPTVSFNALANGAPTSAAWSVDRGDVGTITTGSASTGVFTPSGKTGGLVTITCSIGGKLVTRQVFVKLTASQNGGNAANPSEGLQMPTMPSQLSAGGGVGGVGGEGLGQPAASSDVSALGSPIDDGSGAGLKFLYPYDKTVFPRGQRAPLIMWSWKTGDADAIRMDLSTASGSFSWSGTFGRPMILGATGGKFIRSPIPQDIWDAATNTAGGTTPSGAPDTLTLSLTLASGGNGYGPIKETFTVAPARLSGTVYYNSYGTQYVKNWGGNHDKAGHYLGAAILGIHSGDTAPKLIVGQNSPTDASGVPTDDSGCRVCHVVASRGRWLVSQSEQGTPGDGRSFLYDLQAADVPGSSVQLAQEGVFGWGAMVGDASYMLTNAIDPSSTNPAIINSAAGSATSSFWKFGAAPTAATLSGLPAGVAAAYPSYSPDDKMVAWVDVTGTTSDAAGAIWVASYDASTQTFSGATKVYTPPAGTRVGYPVFLPDNSALLFETQVRTSQSDKVMVTRNGARSELWIVKLGATPTASKLLALNGLDATGKPYLPTGANNHGIAGATDPRSSYDESGWDDTTLNYEPTILPVVEGGYAWVVFTSRRLYGNMLTAVPWQSWPQDYDTTDLGQATVKKLWVAAVALGSTAGADPTFPPFYLPAQEILAGNSRGFWTLDPCRADGAGCDAGDECCGGYCEPGATGALVCTNAPPMSKCAGLEEKCKVDADCCDSTNKCIAGFCASGVR
jgi:hypothetical protein